MTSVAAGTRIWAARDPATGETVLSGWLPGPAGVATLSFDDDDVTLVVDYATPGQFCALTFADDAPSIPSLLEALTVGAGSALRERLADLDPTPQPVWLLDPPGPAARGGGPHGDARSPAAHPARFAMRALCDLAILRADLTSLALGPAVTAMGWVDHALQTFQLPPGIALDLPPYATVDHALAALDAATEELRPRYGTPLRAPREGLNWATEASAYHVLARLLTDFAEALDAHQPFQAHRVRRAAARLDAFGWTPADLDEEPADIGNTRRAAQVAAAAPAPITARSRGADARAAREAEYELHELAMPFDVRLTDADGVEVLEATLTGPECVVVIAPAGRHTAPMRRRHGRTPGTPAADEPTTHWLRVYRQPAPDEGLDLHRRPPVPVAMAPFLPAGRDRLRAVALLPDAVSPDTLIAEVTTRPTDAWESTAEVHIRRAVALGQRAARTERVNDPQADTDWHAAAAAWLEAGDVPRAEIARSFGGAIDTEYAQQLRAGVIPHRTPQWPSLLDRVVAEQIRTPRPR